MTMILTEEEINTFKKAIETYGVESQEDVAIEEMSELTKAIIKNRRYNTEKTRKDIVEETTDVLIMLLQLTFVYGVDGDIFRAKIDRLKKRLDEENKPPEFEVFSPVSEEIVKGVLNNGEENQQ